MSKRRKTSKHIQKNFQLSFETIKKPKESFGGSLLIKGNPRTARPFSSKRPMHLVLRSSKAKGEFSLLKKANADIVRKALAHVKRQYGVRVYEFANAGNHIHMALRVKNQSQWRGFIRSFTTRIAMNVTGAKKGDAKNETFWEGRPWTRIAHWGQGYQVLKDYVVLNYLEANNVVPRNNRSLAKTIMTSWERGDPI